MIKKVNQIVFLSSVFLATLFFSNVSFAETLYTKNDIPEITSQEITVTESVAARVALDFSSSFLPEKDLVISSIVPIHDISDVITDILIFSPFFKPLM